MKKNIKKVKKFQKTLMSLVVIFAILFGIAVGKSMNTNADEINYEYVSDSIGYNNENSNLNVTNVSDALDELYEKVGKCPNDYECLSESIVEGFGNTSTIIDAYRYDEVNEKTFCVTGEEDTCKKTICYLSKTKGACSPGTIIDYKVNDTETVRFHVLHDNGTTMTLQAQRNTVYNTAWYSGGHTHKEGPQTIMAALKTATNSWSNVKDITLADGMTEFNDGTSANNNCTLTSCLPDDSSDGYSYSKLVNNASIGSTIKSRMITITEMIELGCTTSEKKCPIYLYNYLQDSTSSCRLSGRCTNDTHTENGASTNYGYWTMSVYSSLSGGAWRMRFSRNLLGDSVTSNDHGARAVVVVNK